MPKKGKALNRSKERNVVSQRDRSGNVYRHASKQGTAQRTKATVRYIDKHEDKQIYTIDERGQFRETDRHEAAQRVDDSESKYHQHMVYTTTIDPEKTYVDEEKYAQDVAESIKKTRPDADIYAVAVHTDTDKLHAHVSVGTKTVIRDEQLAQMREDAKTIEDKVREHGHERELSPEEVKPIEQAQERRQEAQHIRQQQQDFHNDQERER